MEGGKGKRRGVEGGGEKRGMVGEGERRRERDWEKRRERGRGREEGGRVHAVVEQFLCDVQAFSRFLLPLHSN